MQTLEATISLLFFIFIISSIFSNIQTSYHLDSSLYRYQLANDVWRVLYLRGNFEYFSASNRQILEQDAEIIKEKTGFCIFVEGIRYTNCRGGTDSHKKIATIEKYLYEDSNPKSITFSIAK